MLNKRIVAVVLMLVIVFLPGCALRTVDQMYCLPKRSEDHKDLHAAIDAAMAGLEYCAPLSGGNQQTLQSADLDGDGSQEYLIYAKGGTALPLHILIFDMVNDKYSHISTIDLNGTAFDQVEYVQMDNGKGVELVVGCQVSDVPIRTVSIYQYDGSQALRLHQTGYTQFMTADLNADNITELFVLRPGPSETDRGVAELYCVENNSIERYNEVNMSVPSDHLKRMILGKLNDGTPAIYIASSIEETALITDVFAVQNALLVNVSLSNESGTSVKTLRNYYVYAEDLDKDGVVELPSLIPMIPLDDLVSGGRHDLIRWYAMNSDGSEINKLFTYHNFAGGWYLELADEWAPRLTVRQDGYCYDFYIWSNDGLQAVHVFTIYALTGPNRSEEAAKSGRFVLVKNDSVTYCAQLQSGSADYGITQESITKSFHLIDTKWTSGEIK